MVINGNRPTFTEKIKISLPVSIDITVFKTFYFAKIYAYQNESRKFEMFMPEHLG